MDKFEVVREHHGDKAYAVGDLRIGKKAEFAHLIPHVLVPATDEFVADWEAKQPKQPSKVWDGVSLREDGPTVGEYVEAGYMAANYPPSGYASRSTPEEIEEAIMLQSANPETAAKRKQEREDALNKMEPPVENKGGTSGEGNKAPPKTAARSRKGR